jgi:hypothetical protein
MAENAGGNDLGVVDDEHVGFAKVVADVGDVAVFDGSGVAVKHHHARQLAPFGRVLGDELRR